MILISATLNLQGRMDFLPWMPLKNLLSRCSFSITSCAVLMSMRRMIKTQAAKKYKSVTGDNIEGKRASVKLEVKIQM